MSYTIYFYFLFFHFVLYFDGKNIQNSTLKVENVHFFCLIYTTLQMQPDAAGLFH